MRFARFLGAYLQFHWTAKDEFHSFMDEKREIALRKWLRRFAYLLLGLIVLIVFICAVAYFIGDGKLKKVYAIPAQSITIPADPASIAEGKRLATVRGCLGCHTESLGGKLLFDSPILGAIYSANLTPGGDVEKWSDGDVLRAIRHGVD